MRTNSGLMSELYIRIVERKDGNEYKCVSSNEFGSDERTIKLIVVEVPGKPTNVRVSEVWSTSASISWSLPFDGNESILKYRINYWRRHTGSQRLNEINVGSSQTSTLIKDLEPGTVYELNILAENEVGSGVSSDSVTFTTGEEEPSAPPTDILVEAKGTQTVKVSWRSPPKHELNGVLKGYYVGFKLKGSEHSFSYKTIEPKQNDLNEYFLTSLLKNSEYKIIVKAYNSAGTGPGKFILITVFLN